MKTLSFLDFVSLFFSALFGVAVIWGILTLFAFSLVFILPVLVVSALVWGGYIWWNLRKMQSHGTTIEGESREVEITTIPIETTGALPTKPTQEE